MPIFRGAQLGFSSYSSVHIANPDKLKKNEMLHYVVVSHKKIFSDIACPELTIIVAHMPTMRTMTMSSFVIYVFEELDERNRTEKAASKNIMVL